MSAKVSAKDGILKTVKPATRSRFSYPGIGSTCSRVLLSGKTRMCCFRQGLIFENFRLFEYIADLGATMGRS